ncbi:hypothetical protein D9E68_25800, partial [Escherichia coli]|nr:hypothetical protein [Escherichia coli]
SAALHIFYDMAIPYEPYGDLTMAHSLPVLPATDTAHSLMSISACRQFFTSVGHCVTTTVL